jgi:hypothetical protein
MGTFQAKVAFLFDLLQKNMEMKIPGASNNREVEALNELCDCLAGLILMTPYDLDVAVLDVQGLFVGIFEGFGGE